MRIFPLFLDIKYIKSNVFVHIKYIISYIVTTKFVQEPDIQEIVREVNRQMQQHKHSKTPLKYYVSGYIRV